jgi:excisionase family DNA binding protein
VSTTVMTLEEVAAFLRVHPSTIYRLLRLGHIPAFKLGSDWRSRKESIEDWLIKQESLIAEKLEGDEPNQEQQTLSRRRYASNTR